MKKIEPSALSRTFEIDLFPGLLCDQRRNGRCWIYASMAPFRQKLNIELSTNYICYFDQMRKVDRFLEQVENWKGRDLSDPALSAWLREPISSVGQWCYFASLVEQHGLVPLEAMPDTKATEDRILLERTLNGRLRFGAWEIRNERSDRAQMLKEIESILCRFLGTPPDSVSWQGRSVTPWDYYRESGINLSDYVTVIHHPSSRWQSPCAYNEEQDPDYRDPFLTLLSVEMDTIKLLVLRQLQNGEQVVIGADVRQNGNRSRGELQITKAPCLSKEDAIAYRQINACHVMSIDGWSSDGRWKVQDSHGLETGPDGHYVMTDSWFDAYVLSAVIRKAYLPPMLLKLLDTPVYMPKEERF